MLTLTPPRRRRGPEILDDPDVDARTRERSMGDVALANALFGGAGAVLSELATVLERQGAVPITLLDVGTGLGDIPARARARAERAGVTLETVGFDAVESLLRSARARAAGRLVPVLGDALRLPFADRGVDVVVCSQVLHHFDDADVRRLLAELDRVARRCVIVADLRRSWIAAAGLWAASFPLGFHPVSRHDGVLSVLRGFTTGELRDAVRDATGAVPLVRRRLGFRVTARWAPRGRLA